MLHLFRGSPLTVVIQIQCFCSSTHNIYFLNKLCYMHSLWLCTSMNQLDQFLVEEKIELDGYYADNDSFDSFPLFTKMWQNL